MVSCDILGVMFIQPVLLFTRKLDTKRSASLSTIESSSLNISSYFSSKLPAQSEDPS